MIGIEIRLSSTAINLADTVTVTLRITAPGPITIEPPVSWLADESAMVWSVAPSGPPKISPRSGGGEQWEQTFLVSPYSTGQSIPLTFSPIKVESLGKVVIETIPTQIISVTSDVTDTGLSSIRPVAGFQPLETPTVSTGSFWGYAACGVVSVILVGLIARYVLRKGLIQKIDSPALPHRGNSPADWFETFAETHSRTEFDDQVWQLVDEARFGGRMATIEDQRKVELLTRTFTAESATSSDTPPR